MPRLRTIALGIGLAATLLRAAAAAPQYWDTSPVAGIQGGNGTWDTMVPLWADSPAGTSMGPWLAGNDAWFVVPSNGASSTLTVTGQITVASVTITGSVYTLIVTNGGQMLGGSALSVVGANAPSNAVIITGPGSRWNAAALNFGTGAAARSNRIVVANGGWLVNGAVTIAQPSGSSNSITVTGAGSVWSNTANVGFANTTPAVGNSITVANGGLATIATSLSPNNSERTSFTVTDPGSVLRIGGGFFIGAGTLSSFTSLVISNGGMAVAQAGISLGESGGDSNGLVVVGAGSVLSNMSGTVTVGKQTRANANALVVTNAGRFVNLGSAAIGSGANTPDTCANNSATVTGSGSVWTNSGDIRLSTFKYSRSNYMKILNGGLVYSAGGTIGSFGGIDPPLPNNSPPTTGNWVTVSGSGSVWNLGNQTLAIGAIGAGVATNGGVATNNWLTVGPGGLVTNVDTFSIQTNNMVNLYGGTAMVSTLIMQPQAQIWMDLATQGLIVVRGNATLNGYVYATNLPAKGRVECTVLTCSGTLSGNLRVGELPAGYTGRITTNLEFFPKSVDLRVVGPAAGTVGFLR